MIPLSEILYECSFTYVYKTVYNRMTSSMFWSIKDSSMLDCYDVLSYQYI